MPNNGNLTNKFGIRKTTTLCQLDKISFYVLPQKERPKADVSAIYEWIDVKHMLPFTTFTSASESTTLSAACVSSFLWLISVFHFIRRSLITFADFDLAANKARSITYRTKSQCFVPCPKHLGSNSFRWDICSENLLGWLTIVTFILHLFVITSYITNSRIFNFKPLFFILKENY